MARRICVLRHSYFPIDVRLRRQTNVLVSSGFEVDVVCLRLPGQRWRERVNGATVYRVPLSHHRGSRLRYVGEYAASLFLLGIVATLLHLGRRYDVVQVNTMPDVLALGVLGIKLSGARLVLDINDLMPELYMAKFGATTSHPVTLLLRLLEGASMRLADRVITVTDEFERILVGRHGRNDIAVVMNCPDATVLPRRAPSRPRWGTGNEKSERFVLMSHGVLVERLGFDTIVRAVALLRDRIPGIELRIVGPGEHGEELRELAFNLGVSDRVSLLGLVPLDRVPDLVADADLGVVANKRDGFADLLLPTKLLEYVWLGKTTVAARTATIANYFDESMLAFFEPGDPHDLARVILDLYQHPERCYDLAVNAGTFSDRYNWATEGKRYRDLLADLADADRHGNIGSDSHPDREPDERYIAETASVVDGRTT